MPKVERLEAREQEIFAKMRARPGLTGRHVTDKVYCNVKAWARRRFGEETALRDFGESTLLRFLMGHGMASILEEAELSQVVTINMEDDSVGSIDLWWRDHPVEIKVSYTSVRKDIGEQTHWLEQIGEYVARTFVDPQALEMLLRGFSPERLPQLRARVEQMRRAKRFWGELWIVHLLGDHGRKFCPEHGAPIVGPGESVTNRPRAVHPETGSRRLICPECSEFLVEGDRDTMLRCHRIDWTWEELQSLHSIMVWREQQLRQDEENVAYSIGNPPPIRWGYQAAFECRGCAVKDFIGCPGIDGQDELLEQLEGSILELSVGGKT